MEETTGGVESVEEKGTKSGAYYEDGRRRRKQLL
jgi:hypothetical protein